MCIPCKTPSREGWKPRRLASKESPHQAHSLLTLTGSRQGSAELQRGIFSNATQRHGEGLDPGTFCMENAWAPSGKDVPSPEFSTAMWSELPLLFPTNRASLPAPGGLFRHSLREGVGLGPGAPDLLQGVRLTVGKCVCAWVEEGNIPEKGTKTACLHQFCSCVGGSKEAQRPSRTTAAGDDRSSEEPPRSSRQMESSYSERGWHRVWFPFW